ncbi:hypothetical protein VKI21_06985 [Cyanobacterium aponinum UTEX 3222]|uniref:hypothetical protein n=1 Tax=Cyanobacterium aponinum TaxID=379064 RepID=UPI00308602D7|nr:hypothetical protein VKI21_06985 [Cyanobacterium aponinum UTEX 3222]
MAAITDLTFEQLNNAAIADPNIGEAIFSFAGDTITLDVKKLTGDSFTAITDEGICEVMFKLRKLCSEAQETVNESVVDPDEQLTSFPPFTYGLPSAQGLVTVNQIQTVQLPLLANTVKGTN